MFVHLDTIPACDRRTEMLQLVQCAALWCTWHAVKIRATVKMVAHLVNIDKQYVRTKANVMCKLRLVAVTFQQLHSRQAV